MLRGAKKKKTKVRWKGKKQRWQIDEKSVFIGRDWEGKGSGCYVRGKRLGRDWEGIGKGRDVGVMSERRDEMWLICPTVVMAIG